MVKLPPSSAPQRPVKTRFSSGLALFLLVHREHASGDREAAEDVDARHHHRGEAQPFRTGRTRGRAGDQRADDDDRRNRVGDANQRRVQRRDRKNTPLTSSHKSTSRIPSSSYKQTKTQPLIAT